jgi:hypothetical protein
LERSAILGAAQLLVLGIIGEYVSGASCAKRASARATSAETEAERGNVIPL